jgi:hypothetical protein
MIRSITFACALSAIISYEVQSLDITAARTAVEATATDQGTPVLPPGVLQIVQEMATKGMGLPPDDICILEIAAPLAIEQVVASQKETSLSPPGVLQIVREMANAMKLPPDDICILEIAAPLAIEQVVASQKGTPLSPPVVLKIVREMANAMKLLPDDIRILEVATQVAVGSSKLIKVSRWLHTAYAKFLHERTNGSGNILSYITGSKDHPVIVELTSGGATTKERFEKLNELKLRLGVVIYSLTALDVVLMHNMDIRHAPVDISPGIKTISWNESIALHLEQLAAEKVDEELATYLLTALEKYVATVLEIVETAATSDQTLRGKMKDAPLVTEKQYGTQVLQQLQELKLNLKQEEKRKNFCRLIKFCLLDSVGVAGAAGVGLGWETEPINWLKRAMHTEVQFAVLGHHSLEDSFKMLMPTDNRLLSKLNPCISCAQTSLVSQAAKDSTFLYVEPDDDLSLKMHDYLSMNYSGNSKINQAIDNYRKGTLGKMVWKPLEQTFVDYGNLLVSKCELNPNSARSYSA